ncbi:CarboxypepD_reg-like domain protein [uncultured archaeon]|nr:CarboxypepD_reg-like domain protein [uncultured archaeon]
MIFLERTRTSLTLAVMLKDDYSPDKKTIGDVFLKATGVRREIFKHNTGYFLLTNLPDGKHILTGSGRFYKPVNLTIDTKSINPKQPFAELTLSPKSNYPFPDGFTVLKGKIVDVDYKPLSDVSIKVKLMPQSTTSEEDGGFFIQFAGITGDKNITLTISKSGYINGNVPVLLKKNIVTRIIDPIMLTRL